MKQLIDIFLVFDFIPDQHKTQEMCNIVVSLYPSLYPQLLLLIVYCSDKYESQKMRDDVVDDCVAALKFIPDWFVTNKILEKNDNALYANDDILFYNKYFHEATFIANQEYILAVDLEKN